MAEHQISPDSLGGTTAPAAALEIHNIIANIGPSGELYLCLYSRGSVP
jgi:hypothetical protein